MRDEFKVDIQELRRVSAAILGVTQLRHGETDAGMNGIDDACRALPPTMYQLAAPGLMVARAFLRRSMDGRDRIGHVLEAAADTAQRTEEQLSALFQ